MKFSNFLIVLYLLLISPAGSAFYGERLCKNPAFNCIRLEKTGLGKDFWPDPRELEIIEKINRIHKWYFPGTIMLVPKNMSGKTHLDYSPYPWTLKEFKESPNLYLKKNSESLKLIGQIPHGEKIVIWTPELLAWAAYNKKGELANWGPGLGGADACEGKDGSCRTPSGFFEAIEKKGANHRSDLYPRGCKGQECSWMPYSVKAREDGLSMHGSKWFIGKHASHGCVRLFTADARWLNQNFFEIRTKEKRGTKIIFLPYPKR